jgi:hypothetical protein
MTKVPLVMLLVPLCSDEGRRRRRGKGWTPLAASPAYINIRFSELGPTEEQYSRIHGMHRIRIFLGLLDPDPLVRGTDPAPDPSIIKQKW